MIWYIWWTNQKSNDLFLGVTMPHGLPLGNFQFGCLILTYHPGEEYWFKYSGTFNLSNVIFPFDFVNSIHIARSVPRDQTFASIIHTWYTYTIAESKNYATIYSISRYIKNQHSLRWNWYFRHKYPYFLWHKIYAETSKNNRTILRVG